MKDSSALGCRADLISVNLTKSSKGRFIEQSPNHERVSYGTLLLRKAPLCEEGSFVPQGPGIRLMPC